MATILGLDIGEKRIGVAAVDPEVRVPFPVETFSRARGVAEKEILNLVSERGVNLVVVGLPYSEDGQETGNFESIRQFVSRIERRSKIEIRYVDEYGSTEEARRRLIDSKGKEFIDPKKGYVDAWSASIILERFLSE